MILSPLIGSGVFILLSFAHDGFDTDRTIESYFLPITVGFTVGSIIAYFRYTIESRVRMYEQHLSKEREHAVLGRTAAAIAHQVRNPLNALTMGLQRLKIEARELTPEQMQLVDLMQDAVHRADGIIGDLLRYSRPQQPKFEIMRLDGLVEKLMLLYLPPCREKGIVVRQNIGFWEPIEGDPHLLEQVVENLLRNAIEAQPEGGTLEVILKRSGETARLSIKNGGFSLPPQEAERIFEPYFTTKAQGTGLGVSIARRHVEAHGGVMEVQANGAGQVEIAIRLPLTQSQARSSNE